jgi:hypothetical protein
MTREDPGYVFHVQGHLDDHWATWLGNVTVTHNDDGTSTLVGLVTDQAELYGILAKLRDVGITLIAVTPLTQPGSLSEAGAPASSLPKHPNTPAGPQQSPDVSPKKE